MTAEQSFSILFQDSEAISQHQTDDFTATYDYSSGLSNECIDYPPTFQWNPQDAENSNSFPLNDKEASPTVPIEITNHEARALLAEGLGASVNPESADYIAEISSQLDEITIERHDGEIVKNVKNLSGSSGLNASFVAVRYLVFLSYNNLLSDTHTDKFMRWAIRNKIFWVLEYFIGFKIPAAEIFMSNLLLSATRQNHIDTVRKLLVMGADANASAGKYIRRTALQQATLNQNAHLVKLLLKWGADPNASTGTGKVPTPLQEAVSVPNNLELVEILLLAGADVNIPPNESVFESTLLECAASFGDVEMVSLLLKAKAPVNLMPNTCQTALQAAASYGKEEIVQMLLDARADVDAPTGVIYADARKAAAKNGRFGRLRTPIQHAAENDNVEIVQILLEAGADVNAFPANEF